MPPGDQRQTTPTTAWSQTQTLTAADTDSDEFLGVSVAVDGKRALVGGSGSTDSVDPPGSAHMFRFDGRRWTHEERFTVEESSPESLFGWSVALDGRQALVSRRIQSEQGTATGAVFRLGYENGEWSEPKRIVPDDVTQGDQFGNSVALAGRRALIGAPGTDGTGVASLLQLAADGWQEITTFTPEADTVREFGQSVAIDDKRAVVLASNVEDGSAGGGGVYVFERDGEEWRQQERFGLSEPSASAVNKSAIDIDSGRAIAALETEAAEGQDALVVYLFERTTTGWVQQQRLSFEESPSTSFDVGTSAAIDGDFVVAGTTTFPTADAGAAYFLTYEDREWQASPMVSPDGASSYFGYVVDVADGFAIIGDPGEMHVYEHADREQLTNTPPTAAFSHSPSRPTVGNPVRFDASASTDQDGAIARYEWSVEGDDQFEQRGGQISVTFTTPGEYSVRLRVVDDQGAVATTNRTVQVTEQTNESRPTTVQTDRYPLRRGNAFPVEIGESRYYVITEIPETRPSRRAVTTLDYELTGLDTAEDALFTAEWAQNWAANIDYRQVEQEAIQKMREFRNQELLSRAVELGVDALETYALFQLSPSDAIGPAIGLYLNSINWLYNEINDPYKEGFQKITRTMTEMQDIQAMANQIDSRANFTELLDETLRLAMDLDTVTTSVAEVGSEWATLISEYGVEKSLSQPLSESVGSNLKTAFVGMAVEMTVDELVAGAIGANAKITAAGRAHAAALLPVTRHIIELEQRRRNARLSPAGIVALQRHKMAYAQMTALLAALTSEYYGEMSDLYGGPLYDILANAARKEQRHGELVGEMQHLARLHLKGLGFGANEVQERVDQSINAELIGGN